MTRKWLTLKQRDWLVMAAGVYETLECEDKYSERIYDIIKRSNYDHIHPSDDMIAIEYIKNWWKRYDPIRK